MKAPLPWLLSMVLIGLLAAPEVLAHAPLNPGNNEALVMATPIPDPTKSWAIYADLHEGGEAQYYTFDIHQGEAIHVTLLASTDPSEEGFLPTMALMGSGLQGPGTVPSFVQAPPGAGVVVLEGRRPAGATYEAFAPSSFYQLAGVKMEAPATGTYYIAVFDASRGGKYGLAVGDRESFTLQEWVLTPVSLLSVYQWEGQALALSLAPMVATVAVGAALLTRWRMGRGTPWGAFQALAGLAGLLFLGTAASVLFQMLFTLTRAPVGPEAAITVVWIVGPLLLGMEALRISSTAPGGVDARRRICLASLGVLGLLLWAGTLAGPALALIGSVVPSALALQARASAGNGGR